MQFELSDDQQALRDAARALLAAKAAPARVREIAASGAGYDKALWAEMASQGWPAIELAEADGGLGLGAVETAVLLEEVGRHVAPAPVLSTSLALGALARGGDDRWIGALAAGELIGCVAWAMNGKTEPVIDGPIADVAVVARADGVFAVDLATAGRPAAEQAMDWTREVGWLDEQAPSVQIGDGDAVEHLVDRGAVAHAAEMLGGGQRRPRSCGRLRQGASAVRTADRLFQAVKHRCADMLVDVEGMRSAVYWAAWCIAADDPDRSIAASTAKIWCRRRRQASDGVCAPGARRHRLHVGARPPPVPEARPARPDQRSATPPSTATASPPPPHRASRPASPSSDSGTN